MAGITRLGLGCFTRGLYGSFAGRTYETPTRDTVTRLGLSAITRAKYGEFSGKSEELDVGNNWFYMSKRRKTIR